MIFKLFLIYLQSIYICTFAPIFFPARRVDMALWE